MSQTVKQLLGNGELVVGTFVFEFATNGIGRLAAGAGAQFVIYDTEHTGWGWETVGRLIATTRPTGIEPYVRVPAVRRSEVARALDAGVDVLWVGHFDLTNSLGIPGQFDHPDYLAALDRVVKAAHANGKPAGFMAGSQVEAAMLVERGFRILAYDGDLWVYQDSLRTGIQKVKALR